MARGRTLGAVVAAVLVLGGYGVADAVDVAPGVLTTKPPVPDPLPFPALDLPDGTLVAPTVAGPDAAAPVPTADALAELTAALRADHRLTGAVGVVVADALTGEILLDSDGDTPRLPASSLKILTAAAVLDALGAEHVLTTTAVRGGSGTVVLVGGGDALLAVGEGDPAAVRGRAGRAVLAAQAAAALAGTGPVRVALDDSLFAGPAYAPDVTGADRRYVMPVQALAVDTGLVDGEYAADPALDAARRFASALAAHGVEVTGEVSRTTATADAEVLGEVTSAPVGEIVRDMLKRSDNSTSEVLARLVAVARGATPDLAGATSAVRRRLSDLGVDMTGVRLADGSGLSASSRIPPAVLVDVLLTAMDTDSLRGLVPALPVGGLDGTLDDRLTEEAAGRVRAKTGTLINAVSLTGILVDTGGRLLAFSVESDGLETGTALQARLAIDAWTESVVTCGCA
ncbi:MAG: D-alanyl-D-alanine carboxypeptidase/D-alanyl-D-alanine endopeptidase [Georgenia sp.]